MIVDLGGCRIIKKEMLYLPTAPFLIYSKLSVNNEANFFLHNVICSGLRSAANTSLLGTLFLYNLIRAASIVVNGSASALISVLADFIPDKAPVPATSATLASSASAKAVLASLN